MKTKNEMRKTRVARIRKKISGTSEVPRLAIFKSNRHIYTQVINDEKGLTICAASDLKIKETNPKDKARAVGEDIAKKCKSIKINKVVFDRGGYKYSGNIKILADAARNKGLKF